LSGSVGWTPSGRQRNTVPPSSLREGWSPDSGQLETAPSSALRSRSGGITTVRKSAPTSSLCAPAPSRKAPQGRQVESPPPSSLQRQNSFTPSGRQLDAAPGTR
jgi:hypothetical protein